MAGKENDPCSDNMTSFANYRAWILRNTLDMRNPEYLQKFIQDNPGHAHEVESSITRWDNAKAALARLKETNERRIAGGCEPIGLEVIAEFETVLSTMRGSS